MPGTISVLAQAAANTAGNNLTISAGNGTGTGGSGDIIFQTAPVAGSSGSGANSLAAQLTVGTAGVTVAGTFACNGQTTAGKQTHGVHVDVTTGNDVITTSGANLGQIVSVNASDDANRIQALIAQVNVLTAALKAFGFMS